jgi:hypothetical protein
MKAAVTGPYTYWIDFPHVAATPLHLVKLVADGATLRSPVVLSFGSACDVFSRSEAFLEGELTTVVVRRTLLAS